MKVLHICYIKGIAGAEKMLLYLLPELKQLGIDTEMLVLTPSKAPDAFISTLKGRSIATHEITVPLLGNQFITLSSPELIYKVMRSIKEINPDIINTHLINADLHAIPAAKLSHIPVIISTRHNQDAYRSNWKWRWAVKLTNSFTTAHVAVSSAVKDYIMRTENLKNESVTTIYNGIPVENENWRPSFSIKTELDIPGNSKLICSVGRLIEQKGFEYSLRAFKRVVSDYPDVHYLIVGAGMLRSNLEDQAKELSLSRNVHFLGWRTDIYSIIAETTVFVMPSLWEGFGLVLLEAMSQKKAIIGSKIAPIDELVLDGYNGFLVEPKDINTMALRICQLLGNDTLAETQGANGYRRFIEHFTIQRTAQNYAALYHRLFANRQEARRH